MKAKIIAYTIKHLTTAQQNQIRIQLNGHNATSHGGRYKYRLEGLLDKITHIKPSRSTIIAPEKEAQQILKLLQEHEAKTTMYDIQIDKKEFKIK